jgi:hypothetical protein
VTDGRPGERPPGDQVREIWETRKIGEEAKDAEGPDERQLMYGTRQKTAGYCTRTETAGRSGVRDRRETGRERWQDQVRQLGDHVKRQLKQSAG